MSLENRVTLNNITESVSNLDSNFIPNGTTFHIEEDGSGDFNTLEEAIAYLQGKYSDGIVNIKYGEGTFDINNRIIINLGAFNIPKLYISGVSKDKTFVNVNCKVDFGAFIEVHCSGIVVSDISFKQKDGDRTTQYRGIVAWGGGSVRIGDCYFEGFTCTGAFVGSTAIFTGTVQFKNCNSAIMSSGNSIVSTEWNTSIEANNVAILFHSEFNSRICMYGSISPVTTNVSTKRLALDISSIYYTGM